MHSSAQSSLGIFGGLVPGIPADVKIQDFSNLLYKIVYHFYITYTYLLVYFKSSLDYLYWLIR